MLALLKDFEGMGCPMNAFDRVMKWASEAHRAGFEFPPQAPKRKSFVVQLLKKFNMQEQLPKIKSVKLEGWEPEYVDVVCMDFKSQIRSLLTDPVLMDMEKLSVNPEDPFGNPYIHDNEIDEVTSAAWYRYTYEKEITDKGLQNTMLIGIILYIDKTHIDSFGHFSLEPVSMSYKITK